MTNIELHKMYELNMESIVDIEGRLRVMLALRTANNPYLPEDFDWSWNTSQGRLTKRITKYYFKEHKIKLEPKFIEELGTIAGKFKVEEKTYFVDFTKTFDWDDGDFGDENSCFWGSNKKARVMMESANFMAIRFYDENQRGVGRAWVAPDRPAPDNYILFNAYGPLPLRAAAKVMSTLLGDLPIRYLDLTNNGETTDTLYLNGGRGMMIGTHDYGSHNYDFRISEHIQNKRCICCESPISIEDAYRLRGDEFGEGDSDIVCRTCYNSCFMRCERCGDHMRTQTAHRIGTRSYFQSEIHYEDWCAECAESYSFECDCCHQVFSVARQLSTGLNGSRIRTNLCVSCATANYSQCDICNTYQLNGLINRVNLHLATEMSVCYTCEVINTALCNKCGGRFDIQVLRANGSCPDCNRA